MEATVAFGALTKPLLEQLHDQGLTVSDHEELLRIEMIANAVSTVAIHGLMPRSQSDRARTKLANRLWKIVIPAAREAQPNTGRRDRSEGTGPGGTPQTLSEGER